MSCVSSDYYDDVSDSIGGKWKLTDSECFSEGVLAIEKEKTLLTFYNFIVISMASFFTSVPSITSPTPEIRNS